MRHRAAPLPRHDTASRAYCRDGASGFPRSPAARPGMDSAALPASPCGGCPSPCSGGRSHAPAAATLPLRSLAPLGLSPPLCSRCQHRQHPTAWAGGGPAPGSPLGADRGGSRCRGGVPAFVSRGLSTRVRTAASGLVARLDPALTLCHLGSRSSECPLCGATETSPLLASSGVACPESCLPWSPLRSTFVSQASRHRCVLKSLCCFSQCLEAHSPSSL